MATRRTPSTEPKQPADGELLSAILAELQSLNRTVNAIETRLEAQAASDMDQGRERDPGDAVPPGVAPQAPVPMTPQDKKIRRALEQLPRRASAKKGKS